MDAGVIRRFPQESAVLTEYINTAMERARVEHIGDGTYFAEIPGFVGAWGNGPTAQAAREDLRGGLEAWIVFGLRHNHPMPELNGMDLSFKVAAEVA